MSETQKTSYKEFVKNHCVRDQTQVKNCFLANFKTEIITLSAKISRLKRLLVSNGKFTDFNTEIFAKLIQNLEPEAEELLLSSKTGRSYLGEFGPVFIKQLVFCGCCLKLGLEVAKNELLKDDAKLIYSLILNYYLAGKLININNLQQIKNRILEEELCIGNSSEADSIVYDDFFLLEFPEVDSNDKKQLESIKDYLADERVKDLIEKTSDEIILDKLPINLENINEILNFIDMLPKLTEQQKQVIKAEILKKPSHCDDCILTPNECLINRKKARKFLLGNKEKIKEIWNQERSFRSCLRLVFIESL